MIPPSTRGLFSASPALGLGRAVRWLVVGFAAMILGVTSAHAQTRWTGNTSGNYGTTSNWIGGNVPDTNTEGIQLGPNTVSTLTLNLTTGFTANNITFNSSQAYIMNNGTLTLNTTSANSTILLGNTGSLRINSALTLGRTLNIQTTGSNTSDLTIAGTLTTNNNAIYYNGTGTGTVSISSVIGGSTAVTQASAGTMTLSGTNTFTGNMTLTSGTLNLNSAGALGTSGNFVITGGNIDNTSGSAITLSNGRAERWGGDFGFLGTNALSTGTSGVTLTANVALNVAASTLTIAGVITDGASTFGITKNGTNGTLVLSGTNTYNGTTTLNDGTLSIQNARATGTGGTLVINGGTLDSSGIAMTANNAQTWNGNWTFAGTGTLSMGTGAVTLGDNISINTTASTITIAGAITDGASTFGITKDGAGGTLVLSAANTYNGTTTLNAGTLLIQNAQATGVGGTLVINGGNLNSTGIAMTANNAQTWNGNFTFVGGGTLSMGTGNVTLTDNITLSTTASTLTVAGNISDGGSNFGITKTGTSGTLALTGTNSYTGNTNVQLGTLNVGSQFALQNSVLNFTGGCVTFTGTNITIGGLAGNTNLNPGNGHALTLNNSASTTANYTAVLSSTSSIIMAGAGTQIMSGLNSYTGCTTLSNGTFAVTNLANGGTASGLGQSSGAATNLIFNGGTLQYLGSANGTTNRLFTMQGSSANIDASGSTALVWGNTGAIAFNGTGAARTLNLTGNNTGNNTFQLQITDNGSNKTSVLKDGIGLWVLNATNSTYTGTTTINGGTLVVSNITNGGVGGNIGAATSDAANLVIDGGTLAFNGTAATGSTNRLFSIGANNATIESNNGTGSNFMNWSNTSALGFSGSGNRTLYLGGVNTGNNTLAAIIGNNGSDVTSLTKQGAGTWVLSGANTFTGNTSITGGTLLINNSLALQNSIVNLTTAGTTLSFGNLTSGNVGGLSGNQNIALPSSFTLNINTTTGTAVSYSGILSGTSANVTKLGAGTQTFSGNNTYTGITTVNAGTLVLAGNNTTSGNVVLNGGNLAINNGGNGTSSALGTGTLVLTSGNFDNTSGSTKTLSTNNTVYWNGNVGFTGSNALNLGTGAMTLANNVALTLGGSTLTFGGVIGDGGNGYSITQNGSSSGTVVLSGINTFSGNYNLTSGTLNLNNIQALQFAVLNYTGGSMTWTGFQWFLGGLAGNQNIALPSAGNLALNVTSGRTVSYTGNISGTSAKIVKDGAGTQIFTGTNSYTGSTAINAGTLQVSTLANGGSSSGIGASTGAAANLVLNGGTLSINASSNQSTNRLFTLQTGGGTIENNGTGNVTWGNTGAIVFNGTNAARTLTLGGTNTGNNYFSLSIANNGTGNTSVTKTGVGTWIMNGTSTYSGPTNVTAGILDIASSAGMGSAASGGTVANGATLQLDNGITVGNTSGANFTITGTGVGNIGALVGQTGNNTWNSNISLGGNATISSGTSSNTLFQIGQFESQIAIGSSNLTFIGGATTESIIYSNISGTGAVIVNTSGNVHYYMDGNSYTGGTFINNGTMIIDTPNHTVPVASGNATLGLQGPVKIGDGSGAAGSAILQFAPTNAGATNSDNTIAKDAVVTIERDGWLKLNGQIETIGNLTMNGSKITTDGFDGLQTIFGRLSLGGTGVNSNVTIQSNSVSATIAGNLTMGDSSGTTTTNFNVISGGNTSGDLIVSARVDGGSLYKYGNGTMVLSNSNIYTGCTTVAAGTLNIQNGNALGGTSGVSNGTYVLSNAQLQLQGGFTTAAEPLQINGNGTSNNGALQNISGNNNWTGTVSVGSGNASINTSGGNLTISGNIGVVSGSPTLTVFGSGNTTFSGNVNGALALVKQDTGTLTLSGNIANTYTGNTTVSGGTLALNKTGGGAPAAISGGNVIINTGGTLLNQNDDQILATTNMRLAGGTWNTNGKDEGLGTLTLTANSYLELGNDGVNPLGTSQIHYDVSNYATNWTSGQTLYILDWNGNISGGVNSQVFFGTNYAGLGGSGANQQFSQIVFVNPVGLSSGNYIATILSTGEIVPFLPAPEPGTVAAGAGLAVLALGYEWKRRKSRK